MRSETIERQVARAGWLFLAPALLLIGFFFFLPAAAALLLSITDFDIYALADAGNARVVGVSNYGRLIDHPLFWTSLKNTFYFALGCGPLTVLVARPAFAQDERSDEPQSAPQVDPVSEVPS